VEFIEARNKLEAVARISQLTQSGPETLGPGSKERKSVVVNLAQGLGLEVDGTNTKQEIAEAIANSFGQEWLAEYESVGQTLTLKGLNVLLKAASNHFSLVESGIQSLIEMSVEQELDKISKVVIDKAPRHMNGVSAIIEMKDAEFSQWRATEWQGFYFEFKVRPELINALGGGPKKIGSTSFDYALQRTWDMKVHSTVTKDGKKSGSNCLLNDALSMNQAAEEGGVGLIILSGIPTYDWEFTRWHKKFRSGSNEEPKKPLKKEFESERIDFLFIPTRDRLEKAIKNGELVFFKQGHQPSGEARKIKYSLNLKKALDSDLHLKGADF
jgi:hypothetical protein